MTTHWTSTNAGTLVLESARDARNGRWFPATNHRGEACARISPAPRQWGRGWYVVETRGSLRPATWRDPCPESDYSTAVVRTLTAARAYAVHRVLGAQGL